jgi:hypothetical protein
MKKFIIGSIVGAMATVCVQKLYKKHGNFYTFVNGVKQDMSNEAKVTSRTLNIFDKISLILRRAKLVIN